MKPNKYRTKIAARDFKWNGLNRLKYIILVLFLFDGGRLLGQQIFIDRKIEVDLTKKALDHIYNFQFDESEETIRLLEKQSSTPGVDFLKALLVYWKNLPIKKGTEAYKQYEQHLIETGKKAEDLLKKNGRDVEGIFFAMASYGNLASFYADEGSLMKAVSNARKAYVSLKKGFELKDEFVEFYFTTGIYNYYREKYPENKPVYKPFTWFFERGDKKLGIDQLKFASERALFTKTEAFYYLFHIHLRYEKNASAAVDYARKLHETYPENLLFQAYYCESLLFDKNYEAAARFVENLERDGRIFYQIPANLFHGILKEKYRMNFTEAESHYRKVLELADTENFDVNYYKSLAWAGLARLADRNGDKNKAKEYYNNALKLASYDIVTDEAKAYAR